MVPQFTSDGNQILYLKTDGDLYSIGTDGIAIRSN